MPLQTRLTETLEIEHPILLAPMDLVASGKLAAAVSHAGGLGLIGGGYGDADWLKQEFAAADNARVGCGFITWSLARKPELLDLALQYQPVAVMLSFGDPRPFASKIKKNGRKAHLSGSIAGPGQGSHRRRSRHSRSSGHRSGWAWGEPHDPDPGARDR